MKHHNFKHGYHGSVEHNAWKSAKGRCYNQKNSMYKNYGARGITMCDEWKNDFSKFYEHVGPRPSDKHSLDRIDNNRGYEPGNVRWANDFEQASNRRTNRKFTICCQTHHMREWARIFGSSYKLVHERLTYGWPIEKALSPVKYDQQGNIMRK